MRRRNNTDLRTGCDARGLTAGRMLQRNLGNSDPNLIVLGIRRKLMRDQTEQKHVNFGMTSLNAEIVQHRLGRDGRKIKQQ